jgi:putative hemolysin
MPNPVLLAGPARPGTVHSPDLFPFRRLAQCFLPMARIRELYRRAQQPINRSLLENVLSEMQVEYRVEDSDLARIPSTGAVLVTANHPFGVLDGAILGALLTRVRPDVKVLTNFLLSGIAELHEHCIFVDPFGNRQSAAINRRALRQAVAWLRAGGMLAMFPSGEVSHINLRHMEIVDPEWNLAAARLVRITGADALPVFFRGRNSVPFQAMGLLHPRFRSTWLLNEFLSQEGKKVEVRVGSTISAQAICHAGNDREAARYVRWRTYLLAQRGQQAGRVPAAIRSLLPKPKHQAVAMASPRDVLTAEFAGLRPSLLEENAEFSVYLAEAEQIPTLMLELGRLRELTFRAAGEGTGKNRDLDRFDPHYKHILLWSKTNQELIGAYRMGVTAEILPRFGVDGLYTSTLFRYDAQIFDRLGPALELGRSFVRPEYQRRYAPLLMLWKGIGRYLAAHPELAVLFGAVSISSRYNRVSRELIVRFFQSAERKHPLAGLVAPRRRFRRAGSVPAIAPRPAKASKTCKSWPIPSAIWNATARAFPSCSNNMPSWAGAS